MSSPLSQLLTYDLEQTLARLRESATRYADKHAYLPQDLMIAAVAFTVQLAIESDHAPDPLRKLQRELIAHIEAVRDPLSISAPEGIIDPELSEEDRNKIIDLRIKLLSKKTVTCWSTTEHNLFQHCNLALGVVRCVLEAKRAAQIKVLRVLDLEDRIGGVLPYIPASWGFMDTDSGETPAPAPAKAAVETTP